MSYQHVLGLSVPPAVIAAAKMAGLKTTDYEGRVSPTWEYIQYSSSNRPIARASGEWEGREHIAAIEPLLVRLRDLENPLRSREQFGAVEQERQQIGQQITDWLRANYPQVLADD